jgi:diguanylate cyclase (GGDEF)-like protein
MSNELELKQARAQAETSELRATIAEQQCQRYRHAFLRILLEPFAALDPTVTRLLEVLSTTLDVDRVGLWIFDDAGTAIQCKHQYQRSPPQGPPVTILRRNEYPSYFAAVSRQLTLAIPDVRTELCLQELLNGYLLPLGITAMLDVPVRAFGRFIGILCHEHIQGRREWTVEDQHFAAGVATQVALAFERDRVRRTQEKLFNRSLIDQDTQLPNYLHFENDVSDRLETATAPVTVVVARADQHRLLANTYGRQQSITLLRSAVARLNKHLPSNARMARIAQDEFAVLLGERTFNESTAAMIDDILQWTAALQEPLMAGDEPIYLTLSTGFATSDQPNICTAEQLIADARLAMQQARHEGGARTLPFRPEMRERLENRLQIEQELRRGMAAKEFLLHFQPIMDLRSLQCVGVEALLRWQHPQRGLLCPDDFMPVAVESGAILELGRQTLRAACQGLVRMRQQTQNPDLTISVNMSAPEILASGTAELARAELTRAGLPPSALTLEVTETSLMNDLDSATAMLTSLRSSGIHVSLDDFGTAFSSLSWMHVLPIDSIKIDRGFVAGIPHNPNSTTMVRAIADLARAFKRDVVAEGIETDEQLQAVREMGILLGQGFLFSKAEPCESYTQQWFERLGKH